MDGRDFLAVAAKLAAGPGGQEATYRTAVSRAYYGAFHVARSFLAELGFRPVGNANVHAFFAQYLHGAAHPDARTAAKKLSDLQAARNRADYRLDDPHVGTQRQAMVSAEQAHEVVSAVESCRAEDARDSILRGIAEYERKIRQR